MLAKQSTNDLHVFGREPGRTNGFVHLGDLGPVPAGGGH